MVQSTSKIYEKNFFVTVIVLINNEKVIGAAKYRNE